VFLDRSHVSVFNASVGVSRQPEPRRGSSSVQAVIDEALS